MMKRKPLRGGVRATGGANKKAAKARDKRPVGRPRAVKTVKELEERIEAYFESCRGQPLVVDGFPVTDKHGLPVMVGAKPPTVTGLALALGLNSRQALLNYSKTEFLDTIMRAKTRVEAYAEERLYDREGQRGAEFNLRCNFRWGQEAKEGGEAGGGVVLMAPVLPREDPPADKEGGGDG